MKIEQLQEQVIESLNDLKAIDMKILDVRDLTTLTDTMIICTGRSNRHVKSLAENVIKKAKQLQLSYIRAEGEEDGEWVIVDLADIIIHIFQPAVREYYNLEDLWVPLKKIRKSV